MNRSSYSERPTFRSAGEYIAHIDAARRNGRDPWSPETRDEFLALADEYPELARQYRPAEPFWLEQMGLPPHYGLTVEPFGELWQERFLTTLENDRDFRIAIAHLLKGGRS